MELESGACLRGTGKPNVGLRSMELAWEERQLSLCLGTILYIMGSCCVGEVVG